MRARRAAAAAERVARYAEPCEQCGQVRPDPECWRCGPAWLAEQRAVFAAEQQAARLAERDILEELGEITELEVATSGLVDLVDRLRGVLDAAAVGGGRGRAVELLADAFTVMPPPTRMGRPNAWPLVAGVIALDADYRSGRRSRPGHADTAALTGLGHTAITRAWQHLEAVGWVERTEAGGLATLAQRRTLGVHRLRAEFDVRPLHTTPAAARAPFRAAALQVFGRLLTAALKLLFDAQDALDQARAAAAAETGWDEHVHRARLRAAVAQTSAIVERQRGNPPEGERKCVYSCLCLGLSSGCAEKLSAVGGGARPYGRWEKHAPGEAGGSAHRLPHPRMGKGLRATSPPRRRPPWAAWAPDLARRLRAAWPWLAREPVARIAATIGPELGEHWSPGRLESWLAARLGRPLLAEPYRPLSYLRAVLREARGDAGPPLDRPLSVRQWQHRAQEAQGIRLWESRIATRAAQEKQSAAVGSPAAAADLWPEVARPGSIHQRE